MNKKIASILFVASFAGSFQLYGQRLNGWLRTTGSFLLTDKWKMDMELQGRWQNGLDNSNPLQEKLLFSYRHWIYYRHGESLQFGLSPFAYYNAYKIIEDSSDYHSLPVREYRLTISADIRQRLVGKLYATDKTMLEYRMFDHSDKILRLRNKPGLEYAAKEAVLLRLSYEVLLNASGTIKQHFFDHDRASLSALYNHSRRLFLEIGYMHVTRLPLRSEYTIDENNFFINAGLLLNSKHRSDK